MQYWPFWLSGLALAGTMAGHWLLTHRMMAVSGRFTALVNRFRFGVEADEPELTQEEMIAAIQAMTAESFGEEASAESDGPSFRSPESGGAATRSTGGQFALLDQVLFLTALALGGVFASLVRGREPLTRTLAGTGFTETFGNGPGAFAVLLLGGMLVGFGTRMSSGCTSGHGLCGVSRLQRGSLLATASFFAAGIATSFVLESL